MSAYSEEVSSSQEVLDVLISHLKEKIMGKGGTQVDDLKTLKDLYNFLTTL